MRTLHQTTLALFLVGLSGCVVPVGPEWTNPQSNSPPRIVSSTPPVGAMLSLAPDADAPLVVSVALADQNAKDALYVRWIIDYPPYDSETTRLALETTLAGGDQEQRPELYFAPNCTDHRIAPGFTDHRLLFAASDRQFATDGVGSTKPDAVAEGNFLVEGTWHFEMECQ
jgi:hypothetical protein